MFVDALLFGVLAPLLPSYVESLALSKSQAGVLSGALGAGVLAGAIPTAALVNRIGPKRSVVSGLVGLALGSALFAAATGFEVLVGARFLQGAAGACIWAASLSWISHAAPPGRRGAAIGSLIGIGIAGAVAGPLAGSIALATSVELVFGLIPLAALGLALSLWGLPSPLAIPAEGGLANLLRGRSTRSRVGLGVWLLVLPAMGLGLMTVLAPLRLHDLGVAAGLIGATFVLAGLCEAVTNPIAGRLTDRSGPAPLLGAGMAALSVSALAFALAPDIVSISAASVVGVSVAMGVLATPVSYGLQDVLRRARVGEAHAFGFFNLGFASGNLLGATGGGMLADIADDALPCLLIAAAALITAGIAARASRASRLVPDPASDEIAIGDVRGSG